MVKIRVFPNGLSSACVEYNANSQDLAIPFSEKYTLDESLDAGFITLHFIKQKLPFAPLTFVQIYDEGYAVESPEECYTFWLVQNDEVTEYPAISLYTHNILLIETTKLFERYFVGSKTVTQALITSIKDMTPRPSTVSTIGWVGSNTTSPDNVEYEDWNPPTGASLGDIVNPYASPHLFTNKVTIASFDTIFPKLQGVYASVIQLLKIRIKLNNTVLKTYDSELELGTGETAWNEGRSLSFEFYLKNLGVKEYPLQNITIEYQFYSVNDDRTALVSFTMSVMSKTVAQKYTIGDVVNILCDVAEIHAGGESPKFEFDSSQYEWSSELSPEFTFTEATLKEALSQIGGKVYGIPRLDVTLENGTPKYNVKFDMLNTFYPAHLEKRGLKVTVNGEKLIRDIEQYTSGLDSYAENMVSRNEYSGVLTDPASNAFKTLRAEEGEYRIIEGNAVISTAFPIEQIKKVEIRYDSGAIYDITDFIYEQAEYAALSSYEKVYPNSKQYALYYVHGEKNIRGLSFEVENEYSQALEDPAIVAIYELVSGSQINNLLLASNQNKFTVRVTYVPIISCKVRQRKPTLSGNITNSLIAYNQASNKLDAYSYGRNLAGAISRMGISTHTRLYVIPKFLRTSTSFSTASLKNLCGKVTDDGLIITAVTLEKYTEYIKVQLELTERFYKLNQYVGVESNIRQYEVSEKLAIDRNVVYEDYLVIGSRAHVNEAYSLVQEKFMQTLANTMISTTSVNAAFIEYALLSGGSNTQRIALPVVSLGCGRSMLFHCACLDNYGAGYGATLAKSDYRVQENIRYGNLYGEMKSLDILFAAKTDAAANLNANGESSTKFGANLLPGLPYNVSIANSYFLLGTSANLSANENGRMLRILKDNRERLLFTYQIHVVGEDDIIVSPSIGECFPFVNNININGAYLVILNRKLSGLETVISSSDVMAYYFLGNKNYYSTPTVSRKMILFSPPSNPYGVNSTGSAWAIAQRYTDNGATKYRFWFGKNEALSDNIPPAFYISNAHKISKE